MNVLVSNMYHYYNTLFCIWCLIYSVIYECDYIGVHLDYFIISDACFISPWEIKQNIIEIIITQYFEYETILIEIIITQYFEYKTILIEIIIHVSFENETTLIEIIIHFSILKMKQH